MKSIIKKLKKYYKLILVFIVILIVIILSLFIYKNLFQEGKSNRLDGIENYNLSRKEIAAIEEKLNELESVESIDVYTNYKIIKIFLKLEKNIDFDEVEEKSNEIIDEISEKNLSFYDLEIFVECNDEEGELYPKIGYKHKSDSKFTWNR